MAMTLRHSFKDGYYSLAAQGVSHESLFESEIHGQAPQPPLPDEARSHFQRTRMPETGFRNYWYPVILSRDLHDKEPIRRRLLGEDIVFWRDGEKVHALEDRCPHRGARLSQGHIRFPGSGTISCPYHGWTFDGSGQLRACIQEGPKSVMPPLVKMKAYAVEERLGVVWAWIGDMDPVPVEEDLPVAMNVPGITNIVHFTEVWKTNWMPLFDNFIDGLHAPYLHRLAPQFFFRRLAFRAPDGQPHMMEFAEHDGRILEPRGSQRPGSGKGLIYEMDFPGLGRFPRARWWRFRKPKTRPKETFVPGVLPGTHLLGLPGYVHTIHKNLYYTQFIIPIDRYHLYNMHAISGPLHGLEKLGWKLYHRIFRITHDRIFVGQDLRVLRHSTFGREYLSPFDKDILVWRKFAMANARGYKKERARTGRETTSSSEDQKDNEFSEVGSRS